MENSTEGNVNLELRAPYASWDTFGPVLERIRKRSPTHLDLQVLQGWNVSKPSAQKVLPALRFLKIIGSDGRPTPLWERIAVQDEEKYHQAIDGMVGEAYKKLLDAYPGAFAETDARLGDIIGEVYGTSPSTRVAALTFLKRLLFEAGIRQATEKHEPRITRPSPVGRMRAKIRQPLPTPVAAEMVHPENRRLADGGVTIHLHVNIASDITEAELTEFLGRVTKAASQN